MGAPKQVLSIGGITMLERVLTAFRKSRVDRTVVVLGAHEQDVLHSVGLEDELVVFNRGHAGGMSTSLRAGLSAAGPDASAVIVALADQPFVKTSTIDRLVQSYMDSSPKIVVPVYRGVKGNPVLFDRSVFPEILRIRGDVGAKSVVEGNADRVLKVEVDDEGILIDIDTPPDFEAANSSFGRVKRRRRTQESGRPR